MDQVRLDKMSGLILDPKLFDTAGIPERGFEKVNFENKLADDKKVGKITS